MNSFYLNGSFCNFVAVKTAIFSNYLNLLLLTVIVLFCTSGYAQNSKDLDLVDYSSAEFKQFSSGNSFSFVAYPPFKVKFVSLDQGQNEIWSWAYERVSFSYIDAYEDKAGNVYVSVFAKDSSLIPDKNQIILFSFSPTGEIRWQKRHTVPVLGSTFTPVSMLPHSDSTFVMFSSLSLFDGYASLQFSVVDTSGNLYGDVLLYDTLAWDIPYHAIQTSDNGYLVAMSHSKNESSFADDDCSLVKFTIDSTFSIEWSKTYGGDLRDRDDRETTMRIIEADDGYYFSSITENYGSIDYDLAIYKVDKQGELIFAKRFGTIGYDISRRNAFLLFDDHLVMTALLGSNERLLVFSLEGELIHQYEIGENRQLKSLETDEEKIIISGTNSASGTNEGFLLEFDDFDTLCNASVIEPLTIVDVTEQVDTGSFFYTSFNSNFIFSIDVEMPLYKDSTKWATEVVCEIVPYVRQYNYTRCKNEEIQVEVKDCGDCKWYNGLTDELLDSNAQNYIVPPEVSEVIALNSDSVKSRVVIADSNCQVVKEYFFERCPDQELLIELEGCKNCDWYDEQLDELLATNSTSFLVSTEISQLIATYNIDRFRADVFINASNDYRCYPMSIYELVTPNGDSKNDALKIVNINFYEDAEVSVFDSRNQKIYSASNYQNDWEFNGFDHGTYYVKVESNLLEKPLLAEVLLRR